MTTKATLYLDEQLYKALKMRAVESGHTLSELMNEALQAQLAEDLADLRTIRERCADDQPTLTYEQALAELRSDGLI